MPDRSLVRALAQNSRLQIRPSHELQNRFYYRQNTDRHLAAEIKGLAADFRPFHGRGKEHVCADRVFNIQIIPLGQTIAVDDWGFTADDGPNRPGNDSLETQVAAPVQVAGARDR